MRLRNIPEANEAVANSPFCIGFREIEAIKNKGLPIWLEVGMGKGRFIIDMARAHPEVFFLGIERYTSVLFKAIKRLEGEEEAPGNLRFMCGDARELPEHFKPREVDRIFLNFSDPWPKARHAKRRLTSPEFLSVYERILKEGGQVEFKTDNRELFEYSLETIREAEDWSTEEYTYDLHDNIRMSKDNIMTEYEAKFSEKGQKICKLTATYHKRA